MRERRVHPRYPVGEYGQLRPLEWADMIGIRRAHVVDVSDGGLGVQIDQSIPVGISVRVQLKSGSYLGKVAYCRSAGAVFVAGIAVSGSTRNVSRRSEAAQ